MSAAEQVRQVEPAPAQDGGARAVRRASPRFLRSELRLIARRRRNLAGLLVLAAVPIFIAVAVRTNGQPGGDAPDFFRLITENGLFVALSGLTIELGLFLPLAIAVIAGDVVAGEANLGTLRYLLQVPVSRGRLLMVKYAALVVSAFVAVAVVAVAGLLIGFALFGAGDVTLLSGTQVGLAEGLGRVALAVAYLGCALASLAAVGLFFSTLTEQPIAATITTVVFSTTSYILESIPQVSWSHPYLITHWWPAFGDLFRAPIAWENMTQGLYVALAYVVIFLGAAWARFAGKDVTS